MKKRVLSLILCACLVLGLCPVLNFAPLTEAHAEGETTVYEYYYTSKSTVVNTGEFFTTSGIDGIQSDTSASSVTSADGTAMSFRFKLYESGDYIELNSKQAGDLTIVWKGNSASNNFKIDGTEVEAVGKDVKKETYELSESAANHKIEAIGEDVRFYYIAFTPKTSSGDTSCTHENTITEVPAVAPSCKDGNIAHYKCTDCGALFKDAEGDTALTATDVIDPATGVHAYGEATHTWADDYSSCTASHTCSVCGNVETATAVSVTSETTATCVAAGETTYTATFADSVTWAATTESDPVATSATGNHNYVDGVCSVCQAERPAATGQVHNFTTNEKTDPEGFYTISGNMNSEPYNVDYAGLTLTKGLKIESSTNITFTPTVNGTFTMVFAEETPNIKVNGSRETGANHVITVDVTAGTLYSLTKADTMNLLYMAYTPASTCNHSNKETVKAVPPTCESVGYTEGTKCADCDTILSGVEEVAALGHNYTSEVTTEADCVNPGVRTYTCQNDGTHTYTEDIPATGHNFVEGECSVCHEPQPECEHTNVTTVTVDATCTKDGSVTVTCDDCQATISTETLPAHGVTHVEAVQATCSVPGNREYWYCATCNKYFGDAACTATILNVTTTVPHTWEETSRVEASCIAAGSIKYECTAEGCDAEKSDVISAGHTYDENGECIYAGNVLTNCGAEQNSQYIHNFTTDGMGSDSFFTIAGVEDSTLSGKVVYYNELELTRAIKINSELSISFTANAGDGVVVLIGSSDRKDKNGNFALTELKIVVGEGENAPEYEITMPSDGIIMFAVEEGVTYTIKKANIENPLFYIEYIPGATLATVSESDPDEPSNPDEPTDPDAPTTGDSFITFVAEIGSVQYLTLQAAVDAAQPGDTICLLKDTTENVTIGEGLAVGESIIVHLHGHTAGTIDAATGCMSAESKNVDDNNTKILTITRTEPAHTHVYNGGVETKAPTCSEAGVMTYTCTVENCDHSYTEAIPATGIHVDENDDDLCDYGCGTDMSHVAYIDTDDDKIWDEGTETAFKTLAEALEAAGEVEGGAIVRLLVSTSENYVIIPVGVTLDIEAYTLTAKYVVGFNGSFVIADYYSQDAETAPYGKLVVKQENIVLGETAKYDGNYPVMPFWCGDGYVFAQLGINKTYSNNLYDVEVATEETNSVITFKFGYKATGAANRGLLVDGSSDNDLTFVVRLTWSVAKDGEEIGVAHQDFVFSDSLIAEIVSTNSGFSFELTNFEELNIDAANLTVTAMIISKTGVIASGDTYPKAE